jgi:hypothetical protein
MRMLCPFIVTLLACTTPKTQEMKSEPVENSVKSVPVVPVVTPAPEAKPALLEPKVLIAEPKMMPPATKQSTKVKVQPTEPIPEPALDPGGSVLASIGRGPCFGRCPMFSATIYEDGRVLWNGGRFVGTTGTAELKASAARAKAVVALFSKSKFSTFKRQYKNYQVTDMAEVAIRFRAVMIEHYLGDKSAPRELASLEDALEKTMDLPQFIKAPLE